MVPTAEWTKIPGGGGPVPLARSSHGISCIGNKLYVPSWASHPTKCLLKEGGCLFSFGVESFLRDLDDASYAIFSRRRYVFAGEHVARVPIGSEMHVLDLGSGK